MKMFRFPLLLSLSALGGCAAQGAPAQLSPSPAKPVPSLASSPAPKKMNPNFDYSRASALAKDAAPLVEAQNNFGSRLLERLEAKNAQSENVLLSPTSLWQALSLVQTGARGQTKTELQGLLSLQGLPDVKLGSGNRAFNGLLQEQKGASILVANSAWFADDFKPTPQFVTGAQSDFGASIEEFSHADPGGAATRINEWVSSHTQREIPRIVEGGDIEGQSAVLVNAVYFRGAWKQKFDQAQTKLAPFHLKSGQSVQVPMMNGLKSGAYLSGHSFEGARLPYENTSCALWVLLPRSGKTMLDVSRELSQKEALRLTPTGSVDLRLPRFEINWKNRLASQLAAMNAPLPFSRAANFSAMGEPTAGISEVLHVCKMRVDEEGTVAAAATASMMAGSAMIRQEPKKLTFDRPFVVALVEETSGARLFEGTIYDPTK